ncbi:MAG: DNA processing protein DprA [Thermodesulfobacteriota bacterium]|nr:MAG: DNA processing protein DprA [Thermodesulfobacteriota bacterium]
MREDWKYWIALSMVNGIGIVLIRNLLIKFYSVKDIFEASKKELANVEGIGSKNAEAIKSFNNWDKVDQELEKIEKWGIQLLPLNDPEYPASLLQTYNPPPLLYMKGEILSQDTLSIAIVGSRVPDRYGRSVTETLSSELVSMGVTIVSGLARGIDSIAQSEALKKGGRTIGVLGCGLDQIYPPENKKLYTAVSQNGAVISEFNLGTPPIAQNFPRRNRIISGLSLGVVVVQASEKSGSLISASFALDQNREVFAVPGEVTKKLSRGTNWLIKRGAKLVETVDDIVSEIDALRKLQTSDLFEEDRNEKILASLSKGQKEVFSVLTKDPMHIDEITKMTGIESSSLLSTLLTLELNDFVAQLPGKHFQIK